MYAQVLCREEIKNKSTRVQYLDVSWLSDVNFMICGKVLAAKRLIDYLFDPF